MMRCGQLSSYNQHLTGESLQVLQLQEAHQRRQLLMNRQIVDQTLLAVWTHLQKKLQLDQIQTVFQLLKNLHQNLSLLRPQLLQKPRNLLLLQYQNNHLMLSEARLQ